MIASVFIFSMVDVIVKLLDEQYSAMQIFFFRSLFAILPAAVALRAEGSSRRLKTRYWPIHVLGSFLMMAFLVCNFLALPRISLAEFYVISYSAPLLIVLMGTVLLAEKINLSQGVAVAAGFGGVLYIFQPSGEVFNAGGFLALAGTVLFSITMIVVRILGRTETEGVTAFYFAVIGAIASSVFLPWVWITPDLYGTALLITLGILGGIGQLLMAKAFKDAAAVMVSPFQYTSIFWGVLFGYVFFEARPDPVVLPGFVIIASSGLFLLVQSRQSVE